MRYPRTLVSVPVAAVLGIAIVGCSSASSSTTATSASSPHASASASSSAAASLNGTQLGAALLPAAALPHGFALDPSSPRNTGESTPSDTTQQLSPGQQCSLLDGTSWITATGIIAGSFAQNDYLTGDKTAEIAQEADAYSGGDAQHVMNVLWQVFGRCAQFTDDSGGTSAAITMTRSTLSGIGDQAYEAVQTSSAWDGGNTLVAIRVGNVIVTCWESSPGNDKGSAALRYTESIATKVRSAMG
jgi:hypothetical protein